jgi:hypothetical protein
MRLGKHVSFLSGALVLALQSLASPLSSRPFLSDQLEMPAVLHGGDEGIPQFPNNVPSCVTCQPQWSSISHCAQASAVFANFSQVFGLFFLSSCLDGRSF